MKIQQPMPRVAVLGGDQRQSSMIHALADYGYVIHVWGFRRNESYLTDTVMFFSDWQDAVKDASLIVLPLPATLDGVRVYSSTLPEEKQLRLDVLFHKIEGMIVLGGKLSEEFKQHAEIHAIKCIDYFDSEALQLKNALSTAEGAISIAMRELPCTLDSASIAVIGYGRIGELLARRLFDLGAHVTVYARREEVLTRAEIAGLNAVKLDGKALCCIEKQCRVIFNTVPERIFDESVIRELPKNCIFIDLASAPGGIDHRAAQEKSIKTIWATALPGKYAPESAGIYIAQTIRSILNQKSVTL